MHNARPVVLHRQALPRLAKVELLEHFAEGTETAEPSTTFTHLTVSVTENVGQEPITIHTAQLAPVTKFATTT
jgi:hypothetical protein